MTDERFILPPRPAPPDGLHRVKRAALKRLLLGLSAVVLVVGLPVVFLAVGSPRHHPDVSVLSPSELPPSATPTATPGSAPTPSPSATSPTAVSPAMTPDSHTTPQVSSPGPTLASPTPAPTSEAQTIAVSIDGPKQAVVGQPVSFSGTTTYSAQAPALRGFCVDICAGEGGGGCPPSDYVTPRPGKLHDAYTHTFDSPGTKTVTFFAGTHCQYWRGGARSTLKVIVTPASPSASPSASP